MVAFTTLYHLIAKGMNVVQAVEAMRIASGDDGFLFTTAEESQRNFIEYCQRADTIEMQQRFQQQLPPNSLEPLSKRLKS